MAWLSRTCTQTRHLRLAATLPCHYTTKADYVIGVISLKLNAFSMEFPPANAT